MLPHLFCDMVKKLRIKCEKSSHRNTVGQIFCKEKRIAFSVCGFFFLPSEKWSPIGKLFSTTLVFEHDSGTTLQPQMVTHVEKLLKNKPLLHKIHSKKSFVAFRDGAQVPKRSVHLEHRCRKPGGLDSKMRPLLLESDNFKLLKTGKWAMLSPTDSVLAKLHQAKAHVFTDAVLCLDEARCGILVSECCCFEPAQILNLGVPFLASVYTSSRPSWASCVAHMCHTNVYHDVSHLHHHFSHFWSVTNPEKNVFCTIAVIILFWDKLQSVDLIMTASWECLRDDDS